MIWIEAMWDKSGFWLKLHGSTQYPDGKATELHRYVNVHDRDSFEEIEGVLRSWGLRFDRMSFCDEDGKTYITIAVHPEPAS